MVLSHSTQKISPTFDKLNEIYEIRSMKLKELNPLFKCRFDLLSFKNFATMAM